MKKISLSFLLLVLALYILLEFTLLGWLIGKIGLGYTLVLMFAKAVAGSALARWQGVAVLKQVMSELSAGRLPTQPLLEGVLVLIGGVLLVTPGLVTDSIGITVLIPVIRRWYVHLLRRFFSKRIHFEHGSTFHGPGPSANSGGDDVIDVDFRKEQ